MEPGKKLTLETVKQHNKPHDLWIIIEGKVYNVTKFRQEHPGGEDALDEVAGRDATQDFLDVGHSQEARQIMKKYYVGDLEGGDSLTGKLPVSMTTTTTTPLPPPSQTVPKATDADVVQVVPPEKQCCVLT